ncbi:hypothetical protein [Streptomyces sp.]|uniref:hypothetical protein n=1 Tax=Streptomyces sp. TaxID=1931 RepID=UPI002F3F834B
MQRRRKTALLGVCVSVLALTGAGSASALGNEHAVDRHAASAKYVMESGSAHISQPDPSSQNSNCGMRQSQGLLGAIGVELGSVINVLSCNNITYVA